MPDSIFSSGFLTGLVNEFQPDPKTMPLAAWFPRVDVPSDHYIFDTVTGSRVITDFRDPRALAGVQKVTDRARTKVFLAHLREKKPIDELTLRMIDGPGMRQPEAPEKAIRREMEDLDGIIQRTIHNMQAKVATTGQFTQSSPIALNYDFGLDNKVTLTSTAKWDAPTTATPLANIQSWVDSVRQSGGVEPAEIWMSTEALRRAMATDEVKAKLDDESKREYLRTAKIAELGGLRVVLYDGGYLDSSGTFQRYLPANVVVVKADGPIGKTAFGYAVDSKAPDGWYGKFAKSWVDEDPPGRWILECCSVVVGLEQRNNLFVATVW